MKPFTPVAEFRRWLVMASFFAILGGSLNFILPSLPGADPFVSLFVVLLAYWFMFSMGEGWIQFASVGRRFLWSTAGPMAFAILFFLAPGKAWIRLLFLLPACVEFIAANGPRRRPWVWLLATPLLYGSEELWGNAVRSAASYVTQHLTQLMANALEMPILFSPSVPEAAANMGVLLFVRAAIGSFIASRR